MGPEPSVPLGLAHFAAAHLFGSLFVMCGAVALLAAVVLVGGGTEGGAGDRLTGMAIGIVAIPVFMFGRYLIVQHGVSARRPEGDDNGGGGGRGGPDRPQGPPPPKGPSLQARHVAAGRSFATVRPVRATPVSRPRDREPIKTRSHQ